MTPEALLNPSACAFTPSHASHLGEGFTSSIDTGVSGSLHFSRYSTKVQPPDAHGGRTSRERFSSKEAFVSAGRAVAKSNGWVNGCNFPRALWPLKADGTAYEKIMNVAQAFGLEVKYGDSGKEVYIKFA